MTSEKYKKYALNSFLFLCFTGLSACQTLETKAPEAGEAQAATEEQSEQVETKEDVAEIKIEKEKPEVERPKIPLTEDLLFRMLVAEFAGQRGKLDISIENYLSLAEETRDPLLAERTTRIAVYAKDDAISERAAKLWHELDPENPDPQQVLTVMALRRGDKIAALKYAQSLIVDNKANMEQKLWMFANFLGGESDKQAVLELLEKLMVGHQNDPSAMFAFAQVASRLGDMQRAEALMQQVVKIKPKDEKVIIGYVSLLQQLKKNNEAKDYLKTVVAENPENFEYRLAYARLLTDAQEFDNAREQFEILIKQDEKNVDVIYALGLLNLQNEKYPQAELHFKRLTELNSYNDIASYYLGRIADEQEDTEKAIKWYNTVEGGQHYFDARIRLSLLMASNGEVDKALKNIRNIKVKKKSDKVILVQAEAEILTKEDRLDEALEAFNKEIETNKDTELLYARAMLAEKMGKIDLLESDLNAILKDEPDNAQALNALGYSLTEHTDRYEEAYKYIKRALDLKPDSFYILDSMGWVLYRLGKLDEAVVYLRKALSINPDAEIAAHLGEVLWVMGDRDAAEEVLQTALKDTPEDMRLLKVLERISP